MEITVKNLKGNSWKIGPGHPVFIVAEIGKNFIQTEKEQLVTVYLKNAKRLVDEAQKVGADAVKFQTHALDEHLNIKIISPHFNSEDRLSWIRRNVKATPYTAFWKPLKEYCDKKGILFFTTPMSKGAAKRISGLNMPLWKVGSGDILDFVLLHYLAETQKPIIMSTGMSTLTEISKAIKFLGGQGVQPAILHCVSKYPCPPEELNLSTIQFLKKKFNLVVGFSDHSISIEPAQAAVALGARVIEKHFSLDRNLWGPDHKVSLTPKEFKAMVLSIRSIEKNIQKISGDFYKPYLGKPGKIVQDAEKIFRPIFRKALVAAQAIKKGTRITVDLVQAMRPQKYIAGLASEELLSIIGRRTAVAFSKHEPLTREKLK